MYTASLGTTFTHSIKGTVSSRVDHGISKDTLVACDASNLQISYLNDPSNLHPARHSADSKIIRQLVVFINILS